MARSARGLIPPLDLDLEGRTPLFRQIESGFRDAIIGGRMPPGARIPSTRTLAAALGVSRTTVMLAFDHLLAAGYLDSKPGGGTYVAAEPPLSELDPDALEERKPATRLSHRAQDLLDVPEWPSDANLISRPFSLGLASAADFPYEAWARCIGDARRALEGGAGGATPGGHERLRQAAAAFLRVTRGVVCDPLQVVVVGSLQEALHLVGTTLMDPGDFFWHADPGHSAHRWVLERLGGRPVAVGVDADGIDVDAGRRASPDARLVALSPSGEFPLARRTVRARRMALLDWAREVDAYVVEDDWDPASFLFGRPSPTMAGQDPDGRVVYVAGLGRMLSPAIRVALMVLPEHLVDPVLQVRRRHQMRGILEGQPPLLDQLALAEFFEGGYLERVARRWAPTHRERHKWLVDRLREDLPDGLQFDPADEFSYAVVWLPEGSDDIEVARRVVDAGVATLPVSPFYAGDTMRPGIVIGSSAFEVETMKEPFDRMIEVLRQG